LEEKFKPSQFLTKSSKFDLKILRDYVNNKEMKALDEFQNRQLKEIEKKRMELYQTSFL